MYCTTSADLIEKETGCKQNSDRSGYMHLLVHENSVGLSSATNPKLNVYTCIYTVGGSAFCRDCVGLPEQAGNGMVTPCVGA